MLQFNIDSDVIFVCILVNVNAGIMVDKRGRMRRWFLGTRRKSRTILCHLFLDVLYSVVDIEGT